MNWLRYCCSGPVSVKSTTASPVLSPASIASTLVIVHLLEVLKHVRCDGLQLPQYLGGEALNLGISGGVVALGNHVAPGTRIPTHYEFSLLLVRQDGSGSPTRLLAGQSLARVVVYQRTVVIVGMCVCRLVQLLGDLITLGSGRQYEVVLAVLVHEPLGQLAVGQVPVADQFVGQCTA